MPDGRAACSHTHRPLMTDRSGDATSSISACTRKPLLGEHHMEGGGGSQEPSLCLYKCQHPPPSTVTISTQQPSPPTFPAPAFILLAQRLTSSSLWFRIPLTKSCRFLSNMRSMLPFTIRSAMTAHRLGPRRTLLSPDTDTQNGCHSADCCARPSSHVTDSTRGGAQGTC